MDQTPLFCLARFRSRISRSKITAIRLDRGRFSSLAHCWASSSSSFEILKDVDVFSGDRRFGVLGVVFMAVSWLRTENNTGC